MSSVFKGIITPTLTPFKKSGELYEKGFDNLLEFLSTYGVNGIFAVGSYGSFPLLSEEERMRVTELSILSAKKYNLTCIAHVGHASTSFTIRLAKFAEARGADAVAAILPYYYSGHAYTDENYLLHFKKLRDAINCPLHVYNNPRTTKVSISPQLLNKLQKIGITGMKDSGADMDRFKEYANVVWKNNNDFDLMPGSGSVFLEGFQMGALACVAGTSVVFPDVVNELYKAITKKNNQASIDAQKRVNQARQIQEHLNMRPASAYDLLDLRGVDVGVPREPWLTLNEAELKISKQRLEELGIL
jgi:dihydrodipicolinate synthase/N-acetylneuraminate lyase